MTPRMVVCSILLCLHGMMLTNISYFHAVFVNGKVCKDPKLAKADDFFFSGVNISRNTSNRVGSTVTPVNVVQIPGLNTLGISLVRIDYAPNSGLNPPHNGDSSGPGRHTLCWLCYIQPGESSHHQNPTPWRCFCFPWTSHSLPSQHRKHPCCCLFWS